MIRSRRGRAIMAANHTAMITIHSTESAWPGTVGGFTFAARAAVR